VRSKDETRGRDSTGGHTPLDDLVAEGRYALGLRSFDVAVPVAFKCGVSVCTYPRA
jgi:hypothetical protein